MIGGAVPRPLTRGGPLLLWALLILGAALAGSAAPVSAQFEQLLSVRQSDYDAAFFNFQSRQRAWESQERQWQMALAAVRAAQASGNADRIVLADQAAMTASLELQRRRRLVDEAEPVVAERRRALQAALGQQADSLQAQMSRTAPALRPQLNSQIGALLDQISELEPQVARGPSLLFFAELTPDPRDNRDRILAKIDLLETRNREAQADLDRLAREIERLKRIEAQQRVQRDVANNLFAEDPPGARAGRPPEPQTPPAGSNTTAPQTIQQKIEAYTAAQSELRQLRQQLDARISAFNVTLRSMGGDL